MAIQSGVNVSKGLGLAVVGVPAGVDVSKGVGLAVVAPRPLAVAKAIGYAVVSTEDRVDVSKAVAFVVLQSPGPPPPAGGGSPWIMSASARATMPIDYGSDLQTFPDLDPAFALLSGPRVLAEAIAKRLTTPRGSLLYAPDYGTDVRAYLNDSVTAAKLQQWQREIAHECEADERVLSASVALTYNAQAMSLGAVIGIATADGPFRLVLNVTAVSLTLLDAR